MLDLSLRDEALTRRQLDAVDWDFPAAGTLRRSIHGLHWFAGNFIPPIPSYLIQLLSLPGQVILDPFSGAGTTLVEAARLGRIAIGIDSNRACAMIARGKLAAIGAPDEVTTIVNRHLQTLRSPLFNGGPVSDRRLDDTELLQWFHPLTLAQLCTIWQQLDDVTDRDTREILRVVFSDTLFTCAGPGRPETRGGGVRRHHWGWIADNVRTHTPVFHDAARIYATNASAAMDAIRNLGSTPGKAGVIIADSRALPLPSASVDAIVTSPPYLGMIDYTLGHRLTYLWRGWSMQSDRRREIGARSTRNRKDAVGEYLAAMSIIVSELERVLRPGGYCAIVIGASRKFPEAVAKVTEAVDARLPLFWGPVGRKPTRRRVADRHAGAAIEYVSVFRKR